ncbi:MAG: bifunctional oligoribonuclease/PAP phosphatase NrnA [Clostridiales bacterium]|nr:bifunctional oligoribonuclease/PAP phosphatase NrnA [Clostridiales bacterium]
MEQKAKKNNTFAEVGKVLEEAKKILIFTHVQIDGDCLGSATALCRMLRNEGKEAWILMDEEVPGYLSFLETDYCLIHPKENHKELLEGADLCFAVDCSDPGRFETLRDLFLQGPKTLCVDHHSTNVGFADVNYVGRDCAAAAEVVYKLIRSMDKTIDPVMATAIYTGMVTDTGQFQYSATTAETHRIAADLMECGADFLKVSIEVYQSHTMARVLLKGRILSELELFADGKAAMAYVSQALLAELGATMDEVEGVVEELRGIKGVEYAVFLKEINEDTVRVSLRSKEFADVSAIGKQFGGGGHVRASGCTFKGTLGEARTQLKKAVEEQWKALSTC